MSCLTVAFDTFNAVTRYFAPARIAAAIVLGVEAAVLGVGGALYLALGVVGEAGERELSLGMAVLAAVAAVGLGFLSRGLAQARRWALSPSITWQVLQGFVGAYALTAGSPVIGGIALGLALVGIVPLVLIARSVSGGENL